MDQKVVVITGASRGIGKAIVKEFANGKFYLALCSRNKNNLDKLLEDYNINADKSILGSFDIRNEDEVSYFINSVVAKTKKIDVLINNAGVAHVSKVEDTTVDKWNEIIDVNLKSTFLMVKHCLPYMNEGAQVINIGSNASKIGFPEWSAYCASKFGVLGFTKSLREEVRSRGIKVSAVLPGPTKTEIWSDLEGDWNSNLMMSPEVIAKSVFSVATQPEYANIDEIDIVPSIGKL